MDWIPVEEVLKHLPAVALWRARAVCKKWKDLIETPGFAAIHYRQHLNRSPPHVLGQDLDSEGPLFRCNPFAGQEASDWVLMEHNMDRVLNSSGGLILGMRGKDFMVWNPLTGASKMLPPLCLDGEPCSKETAMGMDSFGQCYWACVLREVEQGVMIYIYDSGKTGMWNKVLVDSDTLFDTIIRDNKLYVYCTRFSGDVEVWCLNLCDGNLSNLVITRDHRGYRMTDEYFCFDTLVVTAKSLFVTTATESTCYLLKLDSTGFVEETTHQWNDIVEPVCMAYNNILLIAHPDFLALYNYQTKTWRRNDIQRVCRGFQNIFGFVLGLCHV
ncbi:putative F-box protein At3g16210 [Selaginella moellendorffii]|uniref:putative F-box protein At3g16210 n=1 Tax=Selaginella moellendorffii TaxID=88036 RepID=UPI000D1C9845|nr:putative F-box protein At3g16210 [Selaginella moellendorffii]|eukprot:XP_024531031.1 putative F-box protein At3g16210 [Selaginella moellendorffii]